MSRATLQAINLRKFGTPRTNFGRKNYALQKAINDLSQQFFLRARLTHSRF